MATFAVLLFVFLYCFEVGRTSDRKECKGKGRKKTRNDVDGARKAHIPTESKTRIGTEGGSIKCAIVAQIANPFGRMQLIQIDCKG